ncbi:MAG: tRNA uracil 4-sulfurtransferase ThiI [Anaerolineae bacterium]
MAFSLSNLVLARYGEIALKGQNRPRFIRQLSSNVTGCLRHAGIAAAVARVERRIYVETDTPEAAAQVLTRVFGLTSVSPAVRVPVDLEVMKSVALQESQRAGLSAACTFRVQARRADKSFPLTSPEINRKVGAYIQENTGARVNLSDDADVTVGIEVQRDHALIYARVIPGPGGMPVPLSGRVVALISAGLDSPVAAWMMIKRGCAIIPLHLAQSDESERRFRALCQVLQGWSHGWRIKPVVMSHQEVFGAVCERLREMRGERWTCLFCKRTMVRTAEAVAHKHKADGVVLGDSLGQVASQTLENMRIISSGCELPIFRPLIGLDKVEIMALARRIGTYDISAQAAAPCPFLPERPVTVGKYERFRSLLATVEGSSGEGQF